MKNTNSVGYDAISTKGVYPDKLKHSVIKPLFKKGDKELCSNYRPIALIPVISKIFERVIYNNIYSFLEKSNVLKPEQYGFRKGKSTNLAIHDLLASVTSCINSRQPVSVLFMDMSEAFDFVSHKILLSKLYAYGIRGPAHDLIKGQTLATPPNVPSCAAADHDQSEVLELLYPYIAKLFYSFVRKDAHEVVEHTKVNVILLYVPMSTCSSLCCILGESVPCLNTYVENLFKPVLNFARFARGLLNLAFFTVYLLLPKQPGPTVWWRLIQHKGNPREG
ncbi:reverse transcriptase (RNA-dependent DNA polymerase) domain-containing protein [Phthorimaea operculella]|nr:reverse transcriptase (RNA-dependent DNA polymerase) domain-containing protein [Phthorimaea operculella]